MTRFEITNATRGFEEIENLPGLGVRYADTIISQTKLALWALGLEKPYTSTISMRRSYIRTNRRYIERLTETLRARNPRTGDGTLRRTGR